MSISRVSERAKMGLADAVKHRDIEVVEYLLKRGVKPHGMIKLAGYGYRELTFLGKAAMDDSYPMAELLFKAGEDVASAIEANHDAFLQNKKIHPVPREEIADDDHYAILRNRRIKDCPEDYRYSIKLLLDFAVGLDFKNIEFLREIDISGFNFVGISFDGDPVTKDMLCSLHLTGAEKAITTLTELERLEDSNRKSIIKNNLSSAFAKRGKIIEEKTQIVNLVPIGESIKRNDIVTVKLRLAKGESPNGMHDKISLIAWAAAFGYEEMVTLLLTHPEFDKSQIPHAIQSAKLNHRDVILAYLKTKQDYNAKDEDGNTLLHIAARRGDIATVKECIEYKADLNMLNNDGETALCNVAGQTQDCRYAKKLTSDDLTIIQLLLDAKADANKGKYYTPLRLAAKSGSYEAMKMLMPFTLKTEHHYEDYENEKLIQKSEPWFVPLMFDSRDSKNWLDILAMLHLNGADFNYQDHETNFSLLMDVVRNMSYYYHHYKGDQAAMMRYEKQINFLLEHGAKLDTKNKNGETVFDILIRNCGSKESEGYKRIEKLLLRRGQSKEQTPVSSLQSQSFLKHAQPMSVSKEAEGRKQYGAR